MYGRLRESAAFQETQLTQDMECLNQLNGTQLESLATLYSNHYQVINEEMTNMGKDSALLYFKPR